MNGLNTGYTEASPAALQDSTDGGYSQLAATNGNYSQLPTTDGHNTSGNGYSPKIAIDTPRANLSAKEKFIQFKKQSTRRFVNIKNTISGKYKRAEEYKDEEIRSEVSTSPAGNIDREQHSLPPTSCGPAIKSFSNVGRGIKASKSLQNLEQITKDGWRQMADKTSYLGQNIKHRYSSKVDINKLAPKMNYESLNSEIDSDEENRPTDNFF